MFIPLSIGITHEYIYRKPWLYMLYYLSTNQATMGPKNVLKNAEKQVNIYIPKYRFIDPTVGALLDAFPSPHQDDSTQS
jgi:hypothetical protein